MNQATIQHDMQSFLQENLSGYLNLLRQMVAINSFTANPAGVNALAKFTAKEFAALGFEAEMVPHPQATFGHNLVLTRPGRSGRKIGLISHLDTVFSAEEEARNNFAWREVGDRIYGPGTVDIKGGTVLIYMVLNAIREFAPAVFDDMTWLVLLDAAEERDGSYFGQLCVERLGSDALAALIFEKGDLIGSKTFRVTVARKGSILYEVRAKGRSAHAGNSHPKGANAVVQLADTIRQIADLTDYERQITFNVGVIEGGTVTNRVPDFALARGEMRAFDAEVYQDGVNQLLALADAPTVRAPSDGHPCDLSIRITRRTAPWPRNPQTDRLFAFWQQSATELGMQIEAEERGGLSDGNQFWSQIPTLDGLGPAGDNLHCSEQSDDGSREQEYVERNSFVPKTMLNALAILRLVEADRDGTDAR